MWSDQLDSPDVESLVELADRKFFRWKQQALRPEWDRRLREIETSDMGSSGRAKLRIETYRELLEREVRERIKVYRDVAGEYASADMLSTFRLDALRKRIMDDVEASVSTLKQNIVSGARAAGDVLECALPNEWAYTGVKSAILTVTNLELGVLEIECKLGGRAGHPGLNSTNRSDESGLTSGNNLTDGAAQAVRTDAPLSSSRREYKTPLGRNIDRLRKECGWSFDDLAKRTGLDKTLILRHVSKGQGARPVTLKTYADAFTKNLGRSVTVAELESDSKQIRPNSTP